MFFSKKELEEALNQIQPKPKHYFLEKDDNDYFSEVEERRSNILFTLIY